MAYNSKKLKYLREKVRGLKQEEIGKFLSMKRGTYASREAKGDFTPAQFGIILKKLGISEEYFDSFQIPGNQGADIILSTPESLISIEAKIDVTLSVLAELLAKQTGQSATATWNDLKKAVQVEYDRKTNELLKSGQ